MRNRALSSRNGFSSAATPASSRWAASARARETRSAAADEFAASSRRRAGKSLGIIDPGFDRGDPRGQRLAQRRQIGDRDLVLACGGSQGEEALLDHLQLARIELEAARDGFEHGQRLSGLGGGALGRGQGFVEKALSALACPLQPPRRPRQRRLRAGCAAEFADGFVQGFGQALGVLQQAPAGGEAVLFAGLGRERVELGQMMAQQILFVAAGGGEARCLRLAQARGTPIVPGLAHRRGCRHVPGESVEDRAMIGRVQEAALLELTLDLDQAVAELAQEADAGRLVIDKGAAAAVGAQQPAQHDRFAIIVEAGFAQHRIGRVIAPDREFGGDRRLARALAHQPGLAAPPHRQTERVEQDRLPRPGLAGQHAQPLAKGQIKPIDQDNFAYGQAEQHSPNDIGTAGAKPGSACRSRAAKNGEPAPVRR